MASSKITTLRQVFKYYAFLLVVWGFFRFLFKLPNLVEELWFKPVIWLLPILIIWANDKKPINFFGGKLLPTLTYGLFLGAFYWLVFGVIQITKNGWSGTFQVSGSGWIDFAGISLATAITEELAFSGYLFNKLVLVNRQVWLAITTTSVMFTLLHLSIGLFVYKYNLTQMIFFLILVFIVQTGNVWVMSRTKNVLGPILSHWLYGLAAFLIA